MEDLIAKARQSQGYMDEAAMTQIIKDGNTILDPHSTLISTGVRIGTGTIFYPNTILRAESDCTVVIGDNNTFYPGSFLLATQGNIVVGSHNIFGPGGVYVQANYPGSSIVIGDNGRFISGASIMGVTNIGDGCQLLGGITVQSCTLHGGGDFAEPDPDKRGAVLKGMGQARNLTVATGQVINGWGDFAASPLEWQRDYHKPAK